MAVTASRALPRLIGAQAAASDPAQHVWLAASAGTGKTQVLSARVFRLLLNGTDPGAILCLTFTKAGAAEMAGRIAARLAAWVRLPEKELVDDLLALGERTTQERVERARTLFAKVLDAPGGGLRIQTIHGFCQSLLSAFPVEAGLTPGFRPLEPREEAVLARQALADLLVAERMSGRVRTIEAVGSLSLRLGEGGAEAFLMACARRPDAMRALPMGEGVVPFVRRALDVPAGDVLEHLAGCCGDDAFDLVGLRRIAAANRAWGTATGLGRADIVERWLAAGPGDRVKLLGELIGTVRTRTSGELPKTGLAKLTAHEPDYPTLGAALGDCCGDLLSLIPLTAFADLYAEGLMAGRDYADAYETAKRRAGAVDFDDLIRATVQLLQQPGMGDWVRYKLDQDIEHVLIDEAQDTNLDQWTIVESLAREFFAGLGTRGPKVRTLFTVGDHKQAIFGFQGTDPLYFQAAADRFSAYAAAAREDTDVPERERGLPMATLSLTHSFRSTRPVLEFVDAALSIVPAPGLGAPLETHASEVPGAGTVELWPPESGAEPEGEEEWVDDATRALARRIARTIKGWLADGLMLDTKGRRLRPEDVMVLVKRRGELASLIVARLYAEGVPVAGIDRLRLNASLAVQDLLAAIRFVLQPDDSLALASLLTSPLLGWSQEELLAAAAPRPEGTSLWRHMRDGDDPRQAPLRDMLARADLTTPYQFLEELLSGELQGRARLLARLGEEARDPIEELLNAALAFESRGAPSLQTFLDWFDRGDVDIKRDPEGGVDAVRVMTAHGAKGLQAPVVILADALVDPGQSPRSLLRWRPAPDLPELPLLRPRKDERTGPLAAVAADADRRDLEEHWRLFYVAATRAEERLVIAGALGRRASVPPANSWYAAAAAGMDALGVAAGENARVFTGAVAPRSAASTPDLVETAATRIELPDWARSHAPVEARPPRPLAPSAIGDDAVADPPPSTASRAAAERGRLLHALFERLPAIPEPHRREAADRWLAGAGGVTGEEDRAELIAAACDIIGDPRFAAVFGADSLAEAPIAAVVPGGAVVAGTVDRLLVTADAVRVVDFKTGRSAPATPADIPPYHLRQLAAYVAALRVIFPQRQVGAALLYTAGPKLFDLSDDLIAAHLPG